MNRPKVICIGWHKTGTTTLGDALLILGYNVLGARLDMASHLLDKDIDTPLKEAVRYGALQDVPWMALYKELDVTFPKSKFILTVRDEEQWLNSALKHFGEQHSSMREWLYGVGVLRGNEQLFLKRYRQHYKEVQEYFKDRTSDLLVMDLSKGDDWVKLCSFLDCSIPTKKFPHSNKGKHNYSLWDKILDQIRKLAPMPLRQLRLSVLRWLGLPDPRFRFNNREQNTKERESKT